MQQEFPADAYDHAIKSELCHLIFLSKQDLKAPLPCPL